jgi:hypothetical protein
MSQSDNNNLNDGDMDAVDNEIINNTINSFLHNITNSIYNNTFLETDNVNTYLNETFMGDIHHLSSPHDPAVPVPAVPVPAVPMPAVPVPAVPVPAVPAPNRTSANGVGVNPFNHPNVDGTAGNRFLLHPMRFTNIVPNRIYGNVINVTPGIINSLNNNNSILNSVIQRSFNDDKTVFKHVISDEGKKLLKSVLYSSLDTEENKCTIMQEVFEDNTKVIELPCKHLFCEEAIIHWVENESATCPVCRTKLPSKEIRVEKNNINNTDNNDLIEDGGETDDPENDLNNEGINLVRNYSVPPQSYYQSILNNITRIRHLNEEEDTQRAIWNSITNSQS